MTIADTFCKSVPQLPSVWDASRLALGVACLRKHWYATARGLRLNGGTSVHLEWGKAYHHCTEIFDREILAGVTREDVCLYTLNMAFEVSWDFGQQQPRWGQWVDLFQCQDPELLPSKRSPGKLVQNRNRCKYARKAQTDIPLAHWNDDRMR